MSSCLCNLGRMSSLEFKDTVPVKAQVGLPHRWWNVVIHIAALILNALNISCGSKSSWLFDGPWAWLFFADQRKQCAAQVWGRSSWASAQATVWRRYVLRRFHHEDGRVTKVHNHFPHFLDDFSVHASSKVRSLKDEDSSSFGSTSSTHGLSTVSDFGVEPPPLTSFRQPWLHYYDIFARNGFRSYLRVIRKIIFNSAMGDLLIHRDSSSVEYNTRSPTKTSLVKTCSSSFWL